jgi:hypothetical protein
MISYTEYLYLARLFIEGLLTDYQINATTSSAFTTLR